MRFNLNPSFIFNAIAAPGAPAPTMSARWFTDSQAPGNVPNRNTLFPSKPSGYSWHSLTSIKYFCDEVSKTDGVTGTWSVFSVGGGEYLPPSVSIYPEYSDLQWLYYKQGVTEPDSPYTVSLYVRLWRPVGHYKEADFDFPGNKCHLDDDFSNAVAVLKTNWHDGPLPGGSPIVFNE